MNLTNFAASIVRQLDVGPDRTRVGLIYWSDQAVVGFRLDRYDNRQDVIQAISYSPYLGGKTNTAAALRLLRQDVFQVNHGDRANARNIAVVVVNSQSTVDTMSTITEAIQNRLAGFQMIVVGIEERVYNSTELESIASHPRSKNLIYVSAFRELPNVVNSVVSQTCNSIDECISNPCLNNGTCINDNGRYLCLCDFNYAGYNCERRCTQQLDVVFLLDVSGSVEDEYHFSIEFARKVSYGLDINNGQVRVGAIAFSSDINGQFYLNDNIRNREGVVNSMDFPPAGGTTNTPVGLEDIRNTHFTVARGDRAGVQNVVVVVSDGYSNVNPERTPVDAALLKNDGVVIYCVALGDSPQWSELNSISSSPSSDHVFELNSRGNIDDTANNLLNSLC